MVIRNISRNKLWFYAVLFFVGLPLLLWVVPELILAASHLPALAQLIIVGLTLAVITVLTFTTAMHVRSWIGEASKQHEMETERMKAERTAAQEAQEVERLVMVGDPAINQHVRSVRIAAGSLSSNLLENTRPALIDGALQDELVATSCAIGVMPVSSGSIDLAKMPKISYPFGKRLMALEVAPVKNSFELSKSQQRMAFSFHREYASKFLLGANPAVVLKVIGPGGTGLGCAEEGVLKWNPPCERVIWFYLFDIPQEEMPDAEGDAEDPIETALELVAAGASLDGVREPMPDNWKVRRNRLGSRPPAQRRQQQQMGSLRKPFREEIREAEEKWFRRAAAHNDMVIFINNPGDGLYDNQRIQLSMEVIESSCLQDFHPLGGNAVGWGYRNPGHIPPGPYMITFPFEIPDADSALTVAMKILSGDLKEDIPLHCFNPEIPLECRDEATLFVTGNPRPGETLINHLMKMPVAPIVIAHFDETAVNAYAVLASGMTDEELENSRLNLPLNAYGE